MVTDDIADYFEVIWELFRTDPVFQVLYLVMASMTMLHISRNTLIIIFFQWTTQALIDIPVSGLSYA